MKKTQNTTIDYENRRHILRVIFHMIPRITLYHNIKSIRTINTNNYIKRRHV
jgi:hypothetical protein